MASHRKPRLDQAALDPIIHKVDSVHEIIREARNLPLDKIQPNPNQPRKTFDPQADKELKSSIKALGLMEPIIVRPHGDGYQIICGERRYRAARELGLTTIPAIIHKANDLKALRMAYEENVQREDLNLLDEARFLQGLIDRSLVKSRQALATALRVSKGRISQKLAVLQLPPKVQEAFSLHPFLGEHHARALSRISDAAACEHLLAAMVKRQLAGRQAELLIERQLARSTTRHITNALAFNGATIRPNRRGYVLHVPALPASDLANLLIQLAHALKAEKLALPRAPRAVRTHS